MCIRDSNKGVINALFALQRAHSDKVVIGLFGDTMQRIFGGGEPELGKGLPDNWTEFDKKLNHRSARRIIGLGNKIREEDDNRSQFARENSEEGMVRYFLLPHGTPNKEEVEEGIRMEMAEISGDTGWLEEDSDQTAILLLEHKMASRRLGFISLLSLIHI